MMYSDPQRGVKALQPTPSRFGASTLGALGAPLVPGLAFAAVSAGWAVEVVGERG